MAVKTKLPMGIENFREIRTMGYYYIDKTGLIKDLLENLGKVNLFTRPRRFGKTLNMSMLKYFFEIGNDSSLFDGLEIAKEEELFEKNMGKFPVISISLKDATGNTFDAAKRALCSIIGDEAARANFLIQSDHLSETERQQYKKLTTLDDKGEFAMSDELLSKSLLTLSRLLEKHFGQRTIILIDEYDVPLDKAYHAGYYDNMSELIRSLLGRVLKTNDSLHFAVLTGCLRISKESIFTGLNNFNVYTITDVQYNEYFGFTDIEVKKLLEFYGFMQQYNTIKKWYNGYHFGNLEIYCPWDVISYCHRLKMNSAASPQNYWINTSNNDIVKKFIDKATPVTRKEMEELIAGDSIRKTIRQELTYKDIDSKIDNLWSLLLATGYLTQHGNTSDSDMTELAIPNQEIRMIFVRQIKEWFEEETIKDNKKLKNFCRAFQENNVSAIEQGFTSYLKKTISIRDTNARKEKKENFYHGILLGLLGNADGWDVRSNAESGEGYSDISIEIEDKEIGIVIELKYAENANFDQKCQEALQQIKEKRYEETLIANGMKTIYKYGIACYKKRCKVLSE